MSASNMVKTSVTVPEDDLRAARHLNINVSAVLRAALRARLRDEHLDRDVAGYTEAFAEWDDTDWDHVAGDGLDPA